MISSPGIAPVCDGDQLELTCNITGRQVQWSFFRIPENGTTIVNYGRRLLSNLPGQETEYLMVDSILFNISRISSPNTLPLITRLLISPVNSSINRTEVICEDRETRISSSAILNVINESQIQGTGVIINTD